MARPRVAMHRQEIKIRFATPEDADSIYALGVADSAFRVSDVIRFYEKSELAEWAEKTADNLLLVVEGDSEIVGFAFCKIMSHHWAMLDNFYIKPCSRCIPTNEYLWRRLLVELTNRKVTYLTCLVRDDHEAIVRLARRRGFARQHSYSWLELFLK